MNPEETAIDQVIQHAWQALRNGDRAEAQRWAEVAAARSPELEDPWLILAGLAEPAQSIPYLQRALAINPASERAHKGMLWAVQRKEAEEAATQPNLKAQAPTQSVRVIQPGAKPAPAMETAAAPSPLPVPHPIPHSIPQATPHPVPHPVAQAGALPSAQPEKNVITQPVHVRATQPQASKPAAVKKTGTSRKRGWLLLPLALTIVCGVILWAVWPGNATPALAFLRGNGDEQATATLPGAAAEVAKPSYTPTLTPTNTSTPTPTFTPTSTPTNTPTATPIPTNTPIPSNTPIPTDTPLFFETPSPYVFPVSDDPCWGGQEDRWISINLSQQMLYACEYSTTVGSFLVSTGTYLHPTVTGDYRIYIKLESTRMIGPGYDLPNVPYTMYFYKGYGIHGTYWHSNFGTPMSHGCVNMRTSDAQWLYYWASEGTLVHVHY